LTTDWHTASVSYAAITAKVHQPFDVHGNFTPQFALYLVIAVDDIADTTQLVITKLIDANGGINLA
jgi:hypothetical protein